MSPNNSEVHVYAKKGNKWEVEHILKEVSYTQLVVVKSATINSPPELTHLPPLSNHSCTAL